MMNYADAASVPLTSDHHVEARVLDLIGEATRRQLWILFLDVNEVQLPILIPVADIVPETEPGEIAHLLDSLVASVHAWSVILVIERPGGAAFDDRDLELASTLRAACSQAEVPIRGLFLSHNSGVRWLARH